MARNLDWEKGRNLVLTMNEEACQYKPYIILGRLWPALRFSHTLLLQNVIPGSNVYSLSEPEKIYIPSINTVNQIKGYVFVTKLFNNASLINCLDTKLVSR